MYIYPVLTNKIYNMTELEKIKIGAEKFLKGEGTLSEIRLNLKLRTTKGITEYL